jgi:hypothetical protein
MNISDQLLVGALIVFVAVILLIVRNRNKITIVRPDPEPYPRIVDNVAIGERTYADLNLNRCVDVLKVEDGTVYFVFTGQVGNNESLFMDIDKFLERFYRTPNGCDGSSFVTPTKTEQV